MKFVTAYKKGSKCLLKVDFGNNPEGVWATASEKVFEYVKSNFQTGEECNCEFEEKNGQKNITRITKGGTPSVVKPTAQPEPVTDVVDDGKKYCGCGTEIKNPKYNQCYNCNKAGKGNKTTESTTTAPTQKKDNFYPGDYLKPHSPEAVERMTRLSVMQSASSAVGAMVGMLNNADIVAENVIEIYRKLIEEVKK
jgi:hypothetical protein